MDVFVAVGEERSFAAGARRLGISAPAVTRAVVALENQLGVKLLNRTTRHVRVTDAGQIYLENARRILAHVTDAEEAVAESLNAPRGHLSLTAPVVLGKQYVMPAVLRYLNEHPAITLDANLTDRSIDMLQEGVDVGIRVGKTDEPTLHYIPVGVLRAVLCASPAYLLHRAPLRQPADVAEHNIISSHASLESTVWWFCQEGLPMTVEVLPRLAVSSSEAAVEAAVGGLGLIRVAACQVAEELSQGKLVTLLDAFEPEPIPIHIVHPVGRERSRRVSQLVEFLVSALRAVPQLQGIAH
jgi:DNA-binding transcriptional LysR family regulator